MDLAADSPASAHARERARTGAAARSRSSAAVRAYARWQAASVGRGAAPAPAWTPSLPQADGACLGLIEGFGGINATGIALAGDGVTLFTGHPHGRMRCWDLRTGARVWEAEERHARGIQALSLSADGTLLASASNDASVRLWDARSGALLAVLDGHGGTVWSVALAPDGSRALSGDQGGAVRLWRIARSGADCSAELVSSNDAHGQAVWSVAFAPDGARYASAGADRCVRMWDSASGSEIGRMDGHEDTVWSLAFSPEGSRLASGSADRSIRLWDVATLQPVGRLEGHEHGVAGVGFSPDGRLLASASSDHSVRLWDARASRQVACFHAPEDYAWRVLWAPSGAFVVSSHHRDIVRIWDARSFSAGSADGHVAADADGHVAASAAAHAGENIGENTGEHLGDNLGEASPGPLPPALALLPAALRAALEAGFDVSLALLRDLLALTARPRAASGAESDAAAAISDHASDSVSAQAAVLAAHPGMRALVQLGWPPAARISLALVVLALARASGGERAARGDAGGDDAGAGAGPATGRAGAARQAPRGAPASEVVSAVARALAGPAQPATPPPVPAQTLGRGLDRVDERIITLLMALGPAACAREPGLPLAFVGRLSEIVPLRAPERELLGRRLPTELAGQTEGTAFGYAREGISRRGELRALLPSSWALPGEVRAYRHLRGELLYRARAGRTPPRLGPLVIVLDVSPACVGAVSRALRTAAHLLAHTVLRAGLPAYALTAGGAGTVRALGRSQDALELFLARSYEPVDANRTLVQALALRDSLRTLRAPAAAAGGQPLVVLLSHAQLGAEEPTPLPTPHVRALFARYPGDEQPPPWRHACERWAVIDTASASASTGGADAARIPAALAEILS